MKPFAAKIIYFVIVILGLAAWTVGLSFDMMWLSVLGMVLVLLSFMFEMIFHRCPECGKYLGKYFCKHCPHCGAEL